MAASVASWSFVGPRMHSACGQPRTWFGGSEPRRAVRARGVHWSARVCPAAQVLVSIQGLVLVAEPYYNEAGYERQVRPRHPSAAGPAACPSCTAVP